MICEKLGCRGDAVPAAIPEVVPGSPDSLEALRKDKPRVAGQRGSWLHAHFCSQCQRPALEITLRRGDHTVNTVFTAGGSSGSRAGGRPSKPKVEVPLQSVLIKVTCAG